MSERTILPAMFEKYRIPIDAVLKSSLPDDYPDIGNKLRYHMGWVDQEGKGIQGNSGKALRPTLCLFACHAMSGDYHAALPAAAAIELVHNFSLIHDDIQDGDKERRHQPTLWWIWGKPLAFQAGVAMRIMASTALTHLANRSIPPDRLLNANRIIDQRCLQMIEGQYLDICFETRMDITVDDYLDMISKKTGALLGCSLELGALYGGAADTSIEHWHSCGYKLGLAFQIRDDMLGIWGDPKLTGKPLSSDIRRKKKSMPVVYVFQHAKDSQRAELETIYKNRKIGDSDTERVLSIMDELGAQEYTWEMAQRYREEALADLKSLAFSQPDRQLFIEMADFLIERNY